MNAINMNNDGKRTDDGDGDHVMVVIAGVVVSIIVVGVTVAAGLAAGSFAAIAAFVGIAGFVFLSAVSAIDLDS